MVNDEGVYNSNIVFKLYTFEVHCVDVLTILFYKLNLLTKLWLFGSLFIPLA
jgi:hypothetical protein